MKRIRANMTLWEILPPTSSDFLNWLNITSDRTIPNSVWVWMVGCGISRHAALSLNILLLGCDWFEFRMCWLDIISYSLDHLVRPGLVSDMRNRYTCCQISYFDHIVLYLIIFGRLSENELYLIYYLNTFIYHYLIIVFRQDFDQLYIIKYVDMNIPTRFISLLREVKNLSPGSICPGLLRRRP